MRLRSYYRWGSGRVLLAMTAAILAVGTVASPLLHPPEAWAGTGASGPGTWLAVPSALTDGAADDPLPAEPDFHLFECLLCKALKVVAVPSYAAGQQVALPLALPIVRLVSRAPDERPGRRSSRPRAPPAR
jgi:hypothetical protein